MLNIIIPLAGSSELFANAGYMYPKPLIEMHGKIMIEAVLENPLKINAEKRFIFIIKEEDCIKYHLDNTLKLLVEGCVVLVIKKSTSGALCSVLMAIDLISKDDELLILNADQIIELDFNKPLQLFKENKADAGIVTFTSIHPRWSYALIQDEKVVQTAEKNPISKNAIAGYYYFKNATVFFNNSFSTIRKGAAINGVFYTSSVINEYVLENRNVINFPIEDGTYFSFYSPQMIADYELKQKQTL
jgi:NDP-sugar pyrophosphorylase family protein